MIYHYCYATLLSNIDTSHTFDIPEDDHIESVIFADSDSYVQTSLEECSFVFSLTDITGVGATTQGSLQIDADTGKLLLENYPTEMLSFSASILITSTGSLTALDADNWQNYNSGTGLYMSNTAGDTEATIKIENVYVSTVCGPDSTTLTISLSPQTGYSIPNYAVTVPGSVSSSNPTCVVTDSTLTGGSQLYDLEDNLSDTFTLSMYESAQ